VSRYRAASAKSLLRISEVLVHDFHEVAAVVVRSAIVETDHDVALLGQPLIESPVAN
jgi:hypothetical protein